MGRSFVKLTSKGQMTLPVAVRQELQLRAGDCLAVTVEKGEVRLRKVNRVEPLSDQDPIWNLIGSVEHGPADVSVEHDRYLAEGEIARWSEP